MPIQRPSWGLRLALLAALLPSLAPCADETSDVAQGRLLLKQLTERARSSPGDRETIRNEVLALRRRFVGTEVALQAAELLRQMPSVLDRLDGKNIPELERFPWQSDQLVGILGDHRGRHGGAVSCVAFSPDGKLLVSGGANYLRVWTPETMRLVQRLGYSGLTGIAFSKDGKMLAVCSTSSSVSLYDVSAESPPLKLRYTTKAGTDKCYGVAFHPSSKSFAVACFDSHIRIYDATAQNAPEPILLPGHEKAVQAVAYSADEKTLASGSEDRTVRLWDVTIPVPREKAVLRGIPAPVTALAFSTIGKATTLAAGCSDGGIRLCSIPVSPSSTAPRLSVDEPKAGQVFHLSFSANGQTLAVAYAKAPVRLWNLKAGARPVERFKIEGHVGAITAVAYSPDNKLIATGGADWTCRTWDVAGKAPKERFVSTSPLSHIYATSFSPDCQTLASGSVDRVLRIWDLSRPEPKARPNLNFLINGVAYSPDGTRLAVRGNIPTIHFWDSARGRLIEPSIKGLPVPPNGFSYSPDGNSLLVYLGQTASLFNTRTGQHILSCNGHTTNLYGAQFSPDGKKVVTCGGSYLYKDGKIVEINKVPQYTDTTIRIWDAANGTELAVIKGHKKPVRQAFYSPDGKFLYSGGDEGVLVRREMADLNKPELPVLSGVSPLTFGFQFSPDGTRLLGASSVEVKLWDLATETLLREFSLEEAITHVCFASDSRHLAVSLVTGVIYIFRLTPPEMK